MADDYKALLARVKRLEYLLTHPSHLNVGTAGDAALGDAHVSGDVRLNTNGEALEMVRSTGSAVVEVLKILSTTDILAVTVPNSADAAALRAINTAGTVILRLTGAGALGLVDGITAPATAAGFASLYVDSSTGDLMVKFGDGVVKTLATDT